jgi:hypothetical protein
MHIKKIVFRNTPTEIEPVLQETEIFTGKSPIHVWNVVRSDSDFETFKITIYLANGKVESKIKHFTKLTIFGIFHKNISFRKNSKYKVSLPDTWKKEKDLVVSFELRSHSPIESVILEK